MKRWFQSKRPSPPTAPPTSPPPPPPPTTPGGGAWVRPEDFVGADAARNEATVREGFFTKAKKSLKHLPMARETVALYFCMMDSRTPLWVKGMVAAALAYFILPIDAIPDILPLVGFGDDAGVLAATIAAVTAHIKPEHLDKAAAWIHGEVPDLEGQARVISDK